MAKTQYLEYEIYLTDRAQVDSLQNQYPHGIRMAPAAASALYSAPIQEYGSTFSAPCVRSAWFWFKNSSGSPKFPRDKASFTICSGGWFGICFLFGSKTNYIWVGAFLYSPPETPTIDDVPVPEPVAIAQRRWIDGFELPAEGEAGVGLIGWTASRDASRHVDGLGLAVRTTSPSGYRTHTMTTFATNPSKSWERFYMRVRRTPSASTAFWMGSVISAGSNTGARLKLSSGNQIEVYNVNSGTETLLASTTNALDANWHRIDIIFECKSSGAYFRLYIDRALVIDTSPADGIGFGQNTTHQSSRLGLVSGSSNGMEVDFDDWMNADHPTRDSRGVYAGQDWLNGSKIHLLRPNGTTASHTGWTGDWRTLLQIPPQDATGPALTSTTSGATIEVNTTMADLKSVPGSLGMCAMIVSMWNKVSVGTDDGTLGFKIDSDPLNLTTINQATVEDWNYVMYRPSGLTAARKPDSIILRHTKLSTSTSTVRTLAAVVELLGQFGPEDTAVEAVPKPKPTIPRVGSHNAPYPGSQYVRRTVAPQSPVSVKSGTYTGNGTAVELAFRAPVNWFFTRRIPATNREGNLWLSSAVSAHRELNKNFRPEIMVHAFLDPTFVGGGGDNDQEQRYILRIVGSDVYSNENGISYQYIAFMDPGSRFCLNGAYVHDTSVAVASNDLPNTSFLPKAGFFQFEDNGSADALFYKGTGHVTDGWSNLNAGTEIVDTIQFSAGVLTSETNAHASDESVAFSVWRRDDGSSDPGKWNVVKIGHYVGNGATTRTIPLTPAGETPSDRYPLWAVVVPRNATAAHQRDPSHTGSNSTNWASGAQVTTGITGGDIDRIIVGSTLNTSGVTFDFFVIMGGTTACNNGWSCDGEFHPVEPDSPSDGPWDSAPGESAVPPSLPGEPTATTLAVPAGPSLGTQGEFSMEAESTRLLRLASLCDRILFRLGDLDQRIWTRDEIDIYLNAGAMDMTGRLRLIWDTFFLENLPPGFSHTAPFEEAYESFHYGRANWTYQDEADRADSSGLFEIDDSFGANHTCPSEVEMLSRIGASTAMRATAELPRSLNEIERATWDRRTLEAASPRHLQHGDSRYEITTGDVYAFTWRKDGPRTFRKVRVPSQMASTYIHHGSWGIARRIDDAVPGESVIGSWGIPRRLPGHHVMGSSVGWGLPRRFYREENNVKIEFWRQFGGGVYSEGEVDCHASGYTTAWTLPRIVQELPRRYFMYLGDYAQWRALVRNGPGQSYKLAQLYKDRWERDLARIANRIGRQLKERVSRLGGSGGPLLSRPPRPRLPWQYGSRVR